MTLTHRPAVPADHDWIVATIDDAYTQYIEAIGRKPAPMLEDYRAHIDAGVVVIAEHSGAPVGLITMWPVDDHIYVDCVAVPMAGQGLGVGTYLLDCADDRGRALDLDELRLYTNEHMTGNLTWYPSRGFEETHRGVEDGYTRVYYRRRIDGATADTIGP